MLELKNITKSFGDAPVLNGISLALDKGRIMSILGPSGGGKTTLLNIILGITDATGGQILFDGEDLTRVPMEKRGFNIVFQDYALFPNLNAYENITYGLRNNPGVSSEQEIKEMIALLGLEEHLTKTIDELSGGQKQRVALARTLVMKPRLLLLDEPLSALDGVIKESIKAKIKQIVDQYNLTTIMVTHDPEEACTMSDRVLILNQGRIAQYDTPENIIEHPASDFVRDFILHQLEVKPTTSTRCSPRTTPPTPPTPPAANRRSSAPERSDPPCRSNPSRRASSCPTSPPRSSTMSAAPPSRSRPSCGCCWRLWRSRSTRS